METVAVIDFETTGLSPGQGDRATEIAAVILKDGEIIGRYQSLMNTGAWVPAFIESLTGITNEMLRSAPPASLVMQEVADFVGDYPLVAHNASFDSKFWDAEMARIDRTRRQEFVCSLLLSRRIFPKAPSHKLSALIEYANLPVAGRYHRALADAEMAASLLQRLAHELREQHKVNTVSVDLLSRIQRAPKSQLTKCIAHARAV
ncbi:MAG: 3'-5' exonuclease [Denitromonas halophila]|uniref:DNA-directed DNA polymerase n=1 Tax=Denitromonas halophila TaxID=1629404 RepID=A0A557QKA0_9RHOO|nr:3'-5' exonuclease [Denitromonas halophila]TVO53331.1 3'-5' exonuclease [Denitromonas halophila]TVT70254.1 MAG: 3'-5' exonuclease [Denitromonas halophila]